MVRPRKNEISYISSGKLGGFINFITHIPRHESVVISVNKQYWHFRIFYSLSCRALAKPETSENKSGGPQKRGSDSRGHVHFFRNRLHYINRCGKRAVRNNALDRRVKRKIKSRKHRCRAHGNTEKQNFYFTAKAFCGIFYPVERVIAFKHAEAYRFSLAVSVRSLVNKNNVMAFIDKLNSSGEKIEERGAFIAVKHQVIRRAVFSFIKSCRKLQSVTRAYFDFFRRKRIKAVYFLTARLASRLEAFHGFERSVRVARLFSV